MTLEEQPVKKLTIILCLVLLGSLLVAGVSAKSLVAPSVVPSQDDAYRHNGAGVKFVLPKGWKAKPDGEVITVSTADDALQMVFWVPEEDTLDAAVGSGSFTALNGQHNLSG